MPLDSCRGDSCIADGRLVSLLCTDSGFGDLRDLFLVDFLSVLDSVNFVSEEKLTVVVEGDGSACALTCVRFAAELTLSAGFLCLVERPEFHLEARSLPRRWVFGLNQASYPPSTRVF